MSTPETNAATPVQTHVGKPKWIRVKLPTGKNYTQLRGVGRPVQTQYHLHLRFLPQYGRMLGRRHCYLYDFGQHMHQILWILRGKNWTP